MATVDDGLTTSGAAKIMPSLPLHPILLLPPSDALGILETGVLFLDPTGNVVALPRECVKRREKRFSEMGVLHVMNEGMIHSRHSHMM